MNINNFIIQKLTEKEWKIENNNSELNVYKTLGNNMINPDYSYTCKTDGIYYYSRGKDCLFANLGSYDNNLLGLYCLLTNRKEKLDKIIEQEGNKIVRSTSDEDINKIFLNYFSTEYINNNVNFNFEETKRDALNVIFLNNLYRINYVKDEEYFRISVTSTKQELYSEIFKYLIYKKDFEELIEPLITDITKTNELLIRLYCIYSKSTDVIVNKLENQKSL